MSYSCLCPRLTSLAMRSLCRCACRRRGVAQGGVGWCRVVRGGEGRRGAVRGGARVISPRHAPVPPAELRVYSTEQLRRTMVAHRSLFVPISHLTAKAQDWRVQCGHPARRRVARLLRVTLLSNCWCSGGGDARGTDDHTKGSPFRSVVHSKIKYSKIWDETLLFIVLLVLRTSLDWTERRSYNHSAVIQSWNNYWTLSVVILNT